MHPGDLLLGHVQVAQHLHVRPLDDRLAENADPAGLPRERRLEHLADLRPVMVAEHDIGVLIEMRGLEIVHEEIAMRPRRPLQA